MDASTAQRDAAAQAQTKRETSQHLAPARSEPTPPGQYDLYPAFPLDDGKIALGFDALAGRLVGEQRVVLDGYGGVFFEDVREQLEVALDMRGVSVAWRNARDALRSEDEIDALVEPYLGAGDPIFGTRFDGALGDFFDDERLAALLSEEDAGADLTVVYGVGAALAAEAAGGEWETDAFLAYLDVPKNEIQYRSVAGSVRNVGARSAPAGPKPMYKRFYFVDWPALSRHKRALLPEIDLVVDTQRPEEPTLMSGDDLRDGLAKMSCSPFRPRPWFAPGTWGGHWAEEHVPQLASDVPNYAWSFEMIAPENGLAFESEDEQGDALRLEVSFDCLMALRSQEVLGNCAPLFGAEFPIRFDFLDTIGGQNLSLQCHPRPDFIHERFGERFTQDETYYILDCAPEAEVYLGFREDVHPDVFRETLEASERDGQEVDVRRFVQTHPAEKHDLFLIPSGTIHCSGAGNLVLEISATPYIFTFKLYDWMRLGLDGEPRPINIERGFENLRFTRSGERVAEELISEPRVLDEGQDADGNDWQLVHLPTHGEHFYDVHRFDFEGEVEATTDGSVHIFNLVEGQSVTLETENGCRQRFNYAETFAVPAAAERYRLVNEGDALARVVKAFVKEDVTPESDYWSRRIFTDSASL